MNNTNSNPLKNRHDDGLTRLVNSAMEELTSDMEWPSNEIIHAYLTGNCTPEQRDLVLFVLSRSQEFRQFIIDTSEGISELESDHMRIAFDKQAASTRASHDNDLTTHPSIVDQLWEWIGRLFPSRVIVPVLSAAAVVLLVLGTQTTDSTRRDLLSFAHHSDLEREFFVSITPRDHRDSSGPDVELAASPRQAAVRALQECIRYNVATDEYDLEVGKGSSEFQGLHRQFNITILVNGAEPITISTSSVPDSSDRNAPPVQAWLMVPPSLRLWHVSLSNDSATLRWPESTASQGCITFTYSHEGSYRATPAQVISH